MMTTWVGGGANVDRSPVDRGKQWETLLEGSGACRPCEIIKNIIKMVQFYTNLTMAAVCLHITCSSMHLYQESDGNVEFFFGGGGRSHRVDKLWGTSAAPLPPTIPTPMIHDLPALRIYMQVTG